MSKLSVIAIAITLFGATAANAAQMGTSATSHGNAGVAPGAPAQNFGATQGSPGNIPSQGSFGASPGAPGSPTYNPNAGLPAIGGGSAGTTSE